MSSRPSRILTSQPFMIIKIVKGFIFGDENLSLDEDVVNVFNTFAIQLLWEEWIMKITIEHLENKAVVEDDSAHDICDAVELFEKALLKIGFQIERIDGGFFWKCREIEKKAREK